MAVEVNARPERGQTGPAEQALRDLRPLLLDAAGLRRAVASGRRPGTAPGYRRVELRPVRLGAGDRLQVTSYDATQAFTRNHDWADPGPAGAAATVDALLAAGYAAWRVETAAEVVELRLTRKGRPLVRRLPRASQAAPDRSHDRTKPRLLDPADPVLRALGLTDAAGRVRPSRQDKVRQVEELLRLLAADLDDARRAGRLPPADAGRPLRVLDLGCGNAYLTFGAAAWLAACGQPSEVVGVDVRPAARRRNEQVAAAAGLADRVRFLAAPIAGASWRFPTRRAGDPQAVAGSDPVDVVLALHACDTATDDCLAQAVSAQAPLVLAAPCCHHDLQRQLRGGSPPVPYALVTRHDILRERWADVLTDALRASVLRLLGYRVEVVEFVGTQHTPRNVLLRAHRTGARAGGDVWRDYDRMLADWGVQPRLAGLLAVELAGARAAAGA